MLPFHQILDIIAQKLKLKFRTNWDLPEQSERTEEMDKLLREVCCVQLKLKHKGK